MKKIALFFILFIALFTIYSCSDKGNEMPVNNSSYNEFSDMVFPDFNDVLGEELYGGTLNEEFGVIPFYYTNESNGKNSDIQCGDNDNGHNGNDDGNNEYRYRHGCAYGTILHQLNLTKDQKNQIFDFKKNFHDCVNAARRQYQSAKNDILHEANQQRKVIIDDWKNGDYERDVANQKLNDLHELTKQQIEDLKAEFKAAVANCLCTFLQNIVSVLDYEQQQIFIAWVENNNCIDVECDLWGGQNQD